MLAKEVVAAIVPSGDVVFVEAAWDWFTSYRLNQRWHFDDRRPMM